MDIPKPKGGTRPLGIATVEDRVVQTAMKLVLEPIFEADFHPCSYGYRPKRDAKMASLAIKEDLYDRAWGVVEIDFQSYFTTMPHAKLMTFIRQRVVDGSLLRVIKQSLKVSVASHGQVEPTTVGVPQGSPLSPLDSNISLHLLDQVGHRGAIRRRWRHAVVTPMMPLGLSQKRRAGAPGVCRDCDTDESDAQLRQDTHHKTEEGFDFLGFHFVKRQARPAESMRSISFPVKRRKAACDGA
jgi:retron-type reverse transcriptase